MDKLLVFLRDDTADDLGNGDSGRGIHFEREEGLADGDFDLVVVPGHKLPAAADNFGVHNEWLDGRIGKRVAGTLALFRQSACDIVSIVVDECPLDAVVDILRIQSGRAAASFGELGCALINLLRHRLGDFLHELLIAFIEDVSLLLLPGKEKIREGTAYSVSNFLGVEVTFRATNIDLDG